MFLACERCARWRGRAGTGIARTQIPVQSRRRVRAEHWRNGRQEGASLCPRLGRGERERLDVACGGLLKTLHALLSQGHLDLQHLEVIGVVGLDLAAHALATPLLEAVEFLVDVHG